MYGGTNLAGYDERRSQQQLGSFDWGEFGGQTAGDASSILLNWLNHQTGGDKQTAPQVIYQPVQVPATQPAGMSTTTVLLIVGGALVVAYFLFK